LSPLDGRGIVVTRPEQQAAGLASLIGSAGGRALCFPVMAIQPLRSPELDAFFGRLDAFDLAVFISRNAVEQGLARVRESRHAWPKGLRTAAIGAGTRRALEAEGYVDVIAPEGAADSEALLAEPALGNVAGKRIAIFRGDGGRETLAEGLRSRGAAVVYAECYRRSVPPTDMRPLMDEWARGAVHAVTVSSGEGLANLAAMLGDAGRGLLAAMPLFVPHIRVAGQARASGAADVVVSGAADEEVLAALVAYFRRTG
jgi:uroporphyrinogen-III synthase